MAHPQEARAPACDDRGDDHLAGLACAAAVPQSVSGPRTKVVEAATLVHEGVEVTETPLTIPTAGRLLAMLGARRW